MIKTINKNLIINILIVIGSLLVPIFLDKIIMLGKYKQLVIGSVVNVSLIYTALTKQSKKTLLLVAFLPSFASITSGLLFNDVTFYSKLLIPIIWLGNLSLIVSYKIFKKNYFLTSIISVGIKSIIIYLGFLLISTIFKFPILVKTGLSLNMGIYQFITGIIGATTIYLIKKHSKN